jgi:hypothetical protein
MIAGVIKIVVEASALKVNCSNTWRGDVRLAWPYSGRSGVIRKPWVQAFRRKWRPPSATISVAMSVTRAMVRQVCDLARLTSTPIQMTRRPGAAKKNVGFIANASDVAAAAGTR